MDDLVTWLRAQLDEANTDLHTVECGWHQREFGHEGTDCTCGAPERLRAEVEAKRLLLDGHESERGVVGYTTVEVLPQYGTVCAECGTHSSPELWPCRHVRLLALPYAERPGYREEWR